MDHADLEGRQPVALGLAVRRLQLRRPVITTEALVPLRREAVEADADIAVFPEIFIPTRCLILDHRPDVPLALVVSMYTVSDSISPSVPSPRPTTRAYPRLPPLQGGRELHHRRLPLHGPARRRV